MIPTTARRTLDRIAAPAREVFHESQLDRLNTWRAQDEYAIIVLDALRYDYASLVLPQFFRGDVECVWSAAHDTFEYGRLCWGQRVWDDVRYVSGAVPINSQAGDDIFDIDHFNELYEGFDPAEHLPQLVDAWRDAWEPGLGTVPPESITEIVREHIADEKLVAHYFQPHAPHIGRCSLLGHTHTRDSRPNQGEPVDKPLWEGVRSGETSPEELRLAYLSNIHRACEAIAPLVEDLLQDRPVAIMADHGDLLAEGGDTDLISHPRVPHPEIRRVPWMEVTGVRSLPSPERVEDGSDTAAKLEALGYR